MTPERAKELMPIIAAFAEEKTIQAKGADGVWRDLYQLDVETDGPFRIKQRPREIWVNCYGVGLGQIHTSKEAADDNADKGRTECIHFVEVLP